MQEELQNKSVVLTTKVAKLSGKGLAMLMRAALRQMQKSKEKPGKMGFKQLSKGGSLSNIEITDSNIKAFDPIARKHNVHYKLQKDSSTDPPRWLVYFRAKEVDSMTSAFKEFSTKMLSKAKEKPSVRDTMQKDKALIKNVVRDKTKHKQREGLER